MYTLEYWCVTVLFLCVKNFLTSTEYFLLAGKGGVQIPFDKGGLQIGRKKSFQGSSNTSKMLFQPHLTLFDVTYTAFV